MKQDVKIDGKIKISPKNSISQKNALQLILNKMFDGDIVCEKTYDWLKPPSENDEDYKNLLANLSSFCGDKSFCKKKIPLYCDFVCDGKKIIIEYDERQHFTQARKIALQSYLNIQVNFDRKLWIKACEDVNAKANSSKNRDVIRAYYDSVRDIACHKNGYKLIRIMHGQMDFTKPDAYDDLEKYLNDF